MYSKRGTEKCNNQEIYVCDTKLSKPTHTLRYVRFILVLLRVSGVRIPTVDEPWVLIL